MQSSRTWENEEIVNLLIAEFDNPGGERFLRSHGKYWDKKLKRGDQIESKFTIELN